MRLVAEKTGIQALPGRSPIGGVLALPDDVGLFPGWDVVMHLFF
jgi:hypothetical protein